MKLVQTFTANKLIKVKTIKELFNNYQWGDDVSKQKTHWYVFIWSCMSGYKNCKNLHLYTDTTGNKIVQQLKLPYKKVHIVLDDIDPRFWHYAKIKTYSLQNEPFLHYDIDVVFNKNFPTDALSYKLYYQQIYPLNCDMFFASDFLQAKNFYHLAGFNLPKEFNEFNSETINNYLYGNAGLYGGKDVLFIKNCANILLEEFKKLDKSQLDNLINQINDFRYKKLVANTNTVMFSLIEEITPILMYYKKYKSYDGIGSFFKTTKTKYNEIKKDLEEQSIKMDFIHLMDCKRFDKIELTNQQIDNDNRLDADQKIASKIANNIDRIISQKVHELYPEQAKIIDDIFKS